MFTFQLTDDSSAPHINVRSRAIKNPRRLKKVFIFLIILAIFVTYFLGKYYTDYLPYYLINMLREAIQFFVVME